MQKILVHQDLWQIKNFCDVTLVDEDTEKALKKQLNIFPAQNIQWNWDFWFFHHFKNMWIGWKNLKSPFHWIILIGILFDCIHIILMFCVFPRKLVPAFKLNTSKLVCLLPGTNLVLYVWGTHKRGDTFIKKKSENCCIHWKSSIFKKWLILRLMSWKPLIRGFGKWS